MEAESSKTPMRRWRRLALFLTALVSSTLAFAPAALAQEGGGEASLILPDLGDV